MSPKVSILVPVYNVEAFIERCAISLFEQTFEDIEYLFVNDCTPDNSIEVLKKVIDKYPNRKCNTCIINNETNLGIAGVRNILLDKAKGNFFLFVDSDDYIDHDMIEKMYESIIAEKADIAVCDFIIEWQNVNKIFYQNINANKTKAINSLLRMDTMPGLPNKLIRLSFIKDNNLLFHKDMNVGEDYMLMPKLFYYASKVIKVEKTFYHYIQTNSSSYTKNFSIENIKSIIYALDELTRFFESKQDYNLYKYSILQGKLRKKIEIIFNSEPKYWNDLISIFPEIDELEGYSFLRYREKISYFFMRNNFKKSFYLYRAKYLKIFKVVQRIKGR